MILPNERTHLDSVEGGGRDGNSNTTPFPGRLEFFTGNFNFLITFE